MAKTKKRILELANKLLSAVTAVAMVTALSNITAFANEGYGEQLDETASVQEYQEPECVPDIADESESSEHLETVENEDAEINDGVTEGEPAGSNDSDDDASDEVSEDSEEAENGEEEESEPSELSYPAVTLTQTKSGVKITLSAPEGVLPEGVTMTVLKVNRADVVEAVSDELPEDKELADAIAFDITLYDVDLNPIQPADGSVKVSFSNLSLDGDELSVYHVADNASYAEEVDVLATSAGSIAEIAVEHFSIYVIAGTVASQGDSDVPAIDKFYLLPDAYAMVSGSTINVTPVFVPEDYEDKSVKWKLLADDGSESFAASIDEQGHLTAALVTENTPVTVSATAADGSTSKITIVVKPVLIDKIKLSKDYDYIKVGETKAVSAAIMPDNVDVSNAELVWTSSDESVLTVDREGNITAVAQGKATITATSIASNVFSEIEITSYDGDPAEGTASICVTNSKGYGTFSFPLYADGTPVEAETVILPQVEIDGKTYVTRGVVQYDKTDYLKTGEWAYKTERNIQEFRYNNGVEVRLAGSNEWVQVESASYVRALYTQHRATLTEDAELAEGIDVSLGDWPYDPGAGTDKNYFIIRVVERSASDNGYAYRDLYESDPCRYVKSPTKTLGQINVNCDKSKYEIVGYKVVQEGEPTADNAEFFEAYGTGDFDEADAKSLSQYYIDYPDGYRCDFREGTHHYIVTCYVSMQEFSVTYAAGYSGDTELPDTAYGLNAKDEYKVDFSVIPTREGYVFSGWTYGGFTYTEGVRDTLVMPAKDIVLTAHWIEEQSSIRYVSDNPDMGGVTLACERITASTDASTLTGSTAMPGDAYSFVGWYDDKGEFLTDNAYFVPETATAAVYHAVFALKGLHVESSSNVWVYDGYEHAEPGIVVKYDGVVKTAYEGDEGELDDGYYADIATDGVTVKDVADGIKDNTFTCTVKKNGEVADDAQFTAETGTIQIVPQSVNPDDPKALTDDPTQAVYTGAEIDTNVPEDVPYNGHEQKFFPTVTDAQGRVLTEGTDYIVEYDGDLVNVTDEGITVTIKGIGNYGGEFSYVYHITPLDITIKADDKVKTYDGKPYGESDGEEFTYAIVSGNLVEGEELSGISYEGDAVTATETGDGYEIVPVVEEGSNPNYNITIVNGKLDIVAGSTMPSNPTDPEEPVVPEYPEPVDPTPTEPTPVVPTPDEPMPDNPAPTVPTTPEPAPSNPVPTNPTPSAPEPTIPTQPGLATTTAPVPTQPGVPDAGNSTVPGTPTQSFTFVPAPVPVPTQGGSATTSSITQVIPDDDVPMASVSEMEIADDENPLGAFDPEPWCWVHWWIILGILVSAVYVAGVYIRRSRFIGKLDEQYDELLGKDEPVSENAQEPAVVIASA